MRGIKTLFKQMSWSKVYFSRFYSKLQLFLISAKKENHPGDGNVGAINIVWRRTLKYMFNTLDS